MMTEQAIAVESAQAVILSSLSGELDFLSRSNHIIIILLCQMILLKFEVCRQGIIELKYVMLQQPTVSESTEVTSEALHSSRF